MSLPSASSPARSYGRSPEAVQRMLAGLRRRSLVVQFWRGALPTIIGVALVGLSVWAGIRTYAGLETAQASAGDIRMVGPEFHGRSREGRPYTVTAESAVRDPQHPERSNLTQPRLLMDTLAHGMVHVAAKTGLYDEQTKIMNLAGDVVADTAKNEHFASPTARVDTAAGTVVGHDSVTVSSDLGQTQSASYAIDNKEGHVVMTGGVHTHLVRRNVTR